MVIKLREHKSLCTFPILGEREHEYSWYPRTEGAMHVSFITFVIHCWCLLLTHYHSFGLSEPIAENNPFFDNNIDDESYGESLNLCDDNSNCEISEVDLDTEKVW